MDVFFWKALQRFVSTFVQWNNNANWFCNKFWVEGHRTIEIVVIVSASCKVAWFSQFCYNRWLKSRNLAWGWVNNSIFYRASKGLCIQNSSIEWHVGKFSMKGNDFCASDRGKTTLLLRKMPLCPFWWAFEVWAFHSWPTSNHQLKLDGIILYRGFRSVVFKSGQKMALRTFFFRITLKCYFIKRSQRHLLAAHWKRITTPK